MIDKKIRFANFAIDLISLVAILMGIGFVSYFFYPELLDEDNTAVDIISYIVYFLYYFIFELTAGRTIGKLLTKTMVVDLNGNKPGVGRILGRTLLRFIPFDGLSFLFSTGGMHDTISKTMVISTEREIHYVEPSIYQQN